MSKNKNNNDAEENYEFYLISNQCRFGCGYRTVEGGRQYFAFHGVPNRNSDYFVNVQISEEEYKQIKSQWPKRSYSSAEAAPFKRRFIDGHMVLLEGEDRLL